MTAIGKSEKTHTAAKKCCGWEEPAIWEYVSRRYANMGVCKYESMQVWEYASIRVCKYKSMQV